jgi:hypothetical protein
MSYKAIVLADSVSPDGVRLTTVELTFPRFILAEVNTHRVLSRNSASSRAIPTEKLIEAVKTNPFVPETFNQRVRGMGYGDPLDDEKAFQARAAWKGAARRAVDAAERLADIGIDKSRVNRLLEPFMWHTAIVSATEWDNLLGLRQPDNDEPVPQADFPAQPEFQIVARMLRDAMRASEPVALGYDQWHLPLVSRQELAHLCQAKKLDMKDAVGYWKLVSAGRCARVSYDRHHDGGDPTEDVARAERLKESGHLSPFEHVARPFSPREVEAVKSQRAEEIARAAAHGEEPFGLDRLWYRANFRGWVQMRDEVPNEAAFHGEVR